MKDTLFVVRNKRNFFHLVSFHRVDSVQIKYFYNLVFILQQETTMLFDNIMLPSIKIKTFHRHRSILLFNVVLQVHYHMIMILWMNLLIQNISQYFPIFYLKKKMENNKNLKPKP